MSACLYLSIVLVQYARFSLVCLSLSVYCTSTVCTFLSCLPVYICLYVCARADSLTCREQTEQWVFHNHMKLNMNLTDLKVRNSTTLRLVRQISLRSLCLSHFHCFCLLCSIKQVHLFASDKYIIHSAPCESSLIFSTDCFVPLPKQITATVVLPF